MNGTKQKEKKEITKQITKTDPNVEQIAVQILAGDFPLENLPEWGDLARLKDLIEERLSQYAPEAAIDVDVQKSSGATRPTFVLGGEEDADAVNEIVAAAIEDWKESYE